MRADLRHFLSSIHSSLQIEKERATSEIYFLPEALKGILLALALALKRIPQNEKILFD
jgi:hypothetical protein